jgi:hypothetical protein
VERSGDKVQARWLGLSAAILAALTVLQWNRREVVEPTPALGLLGSPAMGSQVVSQAGGITMMTVAGTNDDVLLVIDDRREQLFVYRAENQNTFTLLQRASLPQLFADARVKGSGK